MRTHRAILRRRWVWFLTVPLLSVLVSAADSLVWPRLFTRASIVLPPNDHWSGLHDPAPDIESNERFVATQIAVLTTDDVLDDAWKGAHDGASPTALERRAFRGRLWTEREPFNNVVGVTLDLPRPDLLQALLAAFEARFSQDALREASRREGRTRSSLSAAEERVGALGAELVLLLASDTRAGTPRTASASGTGGDGAVEARRLALVASLREAAGSREALADTLREIVWELEQPKRFVAVTAAASAPRQRNTLAHNVPRGLLAGVFLNLILLHGLSARSSRPRAK